MLGVTCNRGEDTPSSSSCPASQGGWGVLHCNEREGPPPSLFYDLRMEWVGAHDAIFEEEEGEDPAVCMPSSNVLFRALDTVAPKG